MHAVSYIKAHRASACSRTFYFLFVLAIELICLVETVMNVACPLAPMTAQVVGSLHRLVLGAATWALLDLLRACPLLEQVPLHEHDLLVKTLLTALFSQNIQMPPHFAICSESFTANTQI